MDCVRYIIFDAGPVLKGDPVYGLIRVQDILSSSIHLRNFLELYPVNFVLESVFVSIFLHTPCVVEDLIDRMTDEEHYEAVLLIEQHPSLLHELEKYTDALKTNVITTLVQTLKPYGLEGEYHFYTVKAWVSATLIQLEYYK